MALRRWSLALAARKHVGVGVGVDTFLDGGFFQLLESLLLLARVENVFAHGFYRALEVPFGR